MRGEDSSQKAEPPDCAELRQALQGRGARIRRLPGVGHTREVAEAEPRVVVGRPDQPVEGVLAMGEWWHREER